MYFQWNSKWLSLNCLCHHVTELAQTPSKCCQPREEDEEKEKLKLKLGRKLSFEFSILFDDENVFFSPSAFLTFRLQNI